DDRSQRVFDLMSNLAYQPVGHGEDDGVGADHSLLEIGHVETEARKRGLTRRADFDVANTEGGFLEVDGETETHLASGPNEDNIIDRHGILFGFRVWDTHYTTKERHRNEQARFLERTFESGMDRGVRGMFRAGRAIYGGRC